MAVESQGVLSLGQLCAMLGEDQTQQLLQTATDGAGASGGLFAVDHADWPGVHLEVEEQDGYCGFWDVLMPVLEALEQGLAVDLSRLL